MTLVLIIDFLVVAGLVGLTLTKGLEWTLPFFAFALVFFPGESIIQLPGLFNLTTQRVAIATIVILYMVLGDGQGRAAIVTPTPLRIFLLIHVFWCVLSTANSVVPVTSIKKMFSEVVEYYLMYYILLRTITRVETIHKIIGAMVFAVFIASIAGSFEAYTGWTITQYFPAIGHYFNVEVTDIGRGQRVESTFENYSLFGSALAFAIIEALYLITLAKSYGRKIYLWLAIFVMFVNIYKTMSRGPWLALIFGSMLFVACSPWQSKRRMLVIYGLAVAVMIIRPGVYDTVKNMYVGTLDTGDPNNQLASSYEYRYALIDVGERALARDRTRELWGYGLESFYYLDLTGPFINNPEYHFLSCDNAWVNLMVETGYVGLLIIALLLAMPAVITVRYCCRIPRPDNYLCWILLINMLQYYFMMTNLAIYSWGQTGYMLWIWIASAMVYGALKQRELIRDKSSVELPVELQTELAWVARA
jgi:O-Antigen ligase